ncbi:hypothetical protein HOB10_02035 [Candidatus Parcubacteria bacterium]|jgi:hypothetical protein|nr:hypothetical protein [Candidatus Parcubacteria bacterium]
MKINWKPWLQPDGLSAPLSDHASSEISNMQGSIFAPPGMATIVAIVACFFGLSHPLYLMWVGIVVAAIWLLPLPFALRVYFRRRQKTFIQNERDYQTAQELRPALQSLSQQPSDSFAQVEPSVGPELRPFRVEHHLSSSLRADLRGSHGWWGPRSMRGRAVPDLLDSSTMVFLTNEAGDETLRVLLPSPRATREMLTQTIEAFSDELPHRSHTQMALNSFAMGDDLLLSPVTNPQTIDQLNAACDRPLLHRPAVNVIGNELQPGIVLGTALEVDGQTRAFLPTGLFQQLQGAITSIAQIEGKKVPQLVQAVQ